MHQRPGVTLLAVFVGGGAGSLARALIDAAVPAADLPASTLLVNTFGALLLGATVGALYPGWPAWARAGAGTGLLGGFTTYSAFALWPVLHPGDFTLSAALMVAGALLGIIAAWTGLAVGRASRELHAEIGADE